MFAWLRAVFVQETYELTPGDFPTIFLPPLIDDLFFIYSPPPPPSLWHSNSNSIDEMLLKSQTSKWTTSFSQIFSRDLKTPKPFMTRCHLMSKANNPVKHLFRLVCDRFYVIHVHGCGSVSTRVEISFSIWFLSTKAKAKLLQMLFYQPRK